MQLKGIFCLGLKKRMCSGSDIPNEEHVAPGRQCYSQPLPNPDGAGGGLEEAPEVESNLFHGFTQPAQMDNLFLSTQGMNIMKIILK